MCAARKHRPRWPRGDAQPPQFGVAIRGHARRLRIEVAARDRFALLVFDTFGSRLGRKVPRFLRVRCPLASRSVSTRMAQWLWIRVPVLSFR